MRCGLRTGGGAMCDFDQHQPGAGSAARAEPSPSPALGVSFDLKCGHMRHAIIRNAEYQA